MDKRLQKRHKRQVSRAKEQVKLSEPDVRSPEQIQAARDASRPAGGHQAASSSQYAKPTSRHQGGTPGTSAAKTDA